MISRKTDDGWDGCASGPYSSDTSRYRDIGRTVLFDSDASSFQGRYFEVAAGGFSRFERHDHEHFVVILRGCGRVRLGDEWHDLGPLDVVHILPKVPHQFANPHEEPFGLLCVVDRIRDVPEPMTGGDISNELTLETSKE